VVISLTVDVEEWYHDLWPGSDKIVARYYHHKLPRGTFAEPLRRVLSLFERCRVSSTFFVLGEAAEVSPEIVEEIYDRGHEVASHGYFHRDLTKVPLPELDVTEKKNRSLLKRITGETPKGFRAPLFKTNTEIISCIERAGYIYDSSVTPSIRIPGWFGNYGAPLGPYHPCKRTILKQSQDREFYEVPLAVFPYLRLPAGGGWFLRNFGISYMNTAIKLLLRRRTPAVLYVHPLDVDSNVPKLRGIPFHVTRRCGEYTLKAMEHILRSFDCKKVAIRDILGES